MSYMICTKIAGRRRGWARLALHAAFVAGAALALCACNTDRQITGAPEVPTDYRLRHPITISEANRTLQLFIGTNRGTLDPTQRAQVLAFAQRWRNEATGGVVIDLPVGGGNARAAAQALPEIRSILAASGVAAESLVVRGYRPNPGKFATVRITYPRIAAQAGPCGLWPEDVGPSFNRDYNENRPPWNFGCANQRNLAAMVVDPADLVQPRAETPAYTARRTTVMEKYRQGSNTATQYPTTDTTKISTSVGQ